MNTALVGKITAGSVMLILAEPLAGNAVNLAGCVEVVFSVEGVRESYDVLRARHIEFTHEPHNVNGAQWAANFRDPDGHQLSLFGPECKAAPVAGEAR